MQKGRLFLFVETIIYATMFCVKASKEQRMSTLIEIYGTFFLR